MIVQIALVLTTVFGAVCMHIFSLNRGFEGSLDSLKRLCPGRSDAWYHRVDFTVVVIAGSIIGSLVYAPSNALEALAAGFGWVGAMNVLTTRGA